MIEKTPIQTKKDLQTAFRLFANGNMTDLLNKINSQYAYWDKVKYMAPDEIDSKVLWQMVKLQRMLNAKSVKFGKYTFRFTITEQMLSLLHNFDMSLGGSMGTECIIPERDKNFYLVSSIMEEAIASSQMEGASTTRKVAKEMLRKQQKPKDKSQQMIVNNYSTIRYIMDHREDIFSINKLKEIHKHISYKTLDNTEDEGNIRTDNDIVVMNGITGEIAHTPPPYEEIEDLLEDLCKFANNDDENNFIHPIIKGIIIHFIFAFIHPFKDGNGRTARSLVYLYMIKKGYWLTEYLSISRIIYRNKNQYERAFLCTENDDYDLSYFIQFNLVTMKKAYEELKQYLQRKINERNSMILFRNVPNINERQAHILKIINEKPNEIFTTKSISVQFAVTDKTARTDLQKLVKMHLMSEVSLNNRMTGYTKADDFETVIEQLSGKNKGVD